MAKPSAKTKSKTTFRHSGKSRKEKHPFSREERQTVQTERSGERFCRLGKKSAFQAFGT